MLFRYPLESTAENWLHDGLATLMTRVLGGSPHPLKDWWLVFPENNQVEIKRKRGLLSRLAKVLTEANKLTLMERKSVLDCMSSQNNIPDLFGAAVGLSNFPVGHETLKAAVHDLYECAFGLLTPLGVRDRQYDIVYKEIPARRCGFCGIEPLESSDRSIPREDLDHYLAMSRYPFAGVNLKNLAPIGHRCNSSYKGAADILFDAAGVRRRCFDPFGGEVARVSLLHSKPLEGALVDLFVLPAWQIDLIGSEPEIDTWDAVFSIRARYRANVLDAEIGSWMEHFAQWWANDVGNLPVDAVSVLALLERYLRSVVQEGFSDNTFLKRATFEMFAHRCQQPEDNGRTANWIISLLSPGTGAVN